MLITEFKKINKTLTKIKIINRTERKKYLYFKCGH